MDQLRDQDKRPASSSPSPEASAILPKSQPENTSTESRALRQDSFGVSESDPWSSPELHRGHSHASAGANEPALNGYGSVRSATNGWANVATGYNNQPESQNGARSNGQPDGGTPSSAGSGWGGYNGGSGAGFGNVGQPGLGGFGPSGDGRDGPSQRRSLGGGRVTGSGVEEVITINLLPEKEGMFMFQHRNYEVKSARRGSSVIRRYSDFVWLLDCLHKRYPFRQLPLLPPKRVAGTLKAQ